MAPACRIEAASMSANGTKDCASRPPALKPARPQSWPTVLSTSGGAECVKLIAADTACRCHEAVKGGAQAQPFQRGHVGIGDAIPFTQPGGDHGGVRDEVGGKFRDRLDVDIERIEKQPAVRRIRA